MKAQRLVLALTVINFVLLVFALDQSRAVRRRTSRPYSEVVRLKSWMSTGAFAQASRSCRQIPPSRCRTEQLDIRRPCCFG